jgi:hypothetical protein
MSHVMLYKLIAQFLTFTFSVYRSAVKQAHLLSPFTFNDDNISASALADELTLLATDSDDAQVPLPHTEHT